jgi:hypothetical protein
MNEKRTVVDEEQYMDDNGPIRDPSRPIHTIPMPWPFSRRMAWVDGLVGLTGREGRAHGTGGGARCDRSQAGHGHGAMLAGRQAERVGQDGPI